MFIKELGLDKDGDSFTSEREFQTRDRQPRHQFLNGRCCVPGWYVLAHLEEAFPTAVPPIRHQSCAMLRERRSFAVEDLTVDTDLLESARQAGYTTKVFFISTEVYLAKTSYTHKMNDLAQGLIRTITIIFRQLLSQRQRCALSTVTFAGGFIPTDAGHRDVVLAFEIIALYPVFRSGSSSRILEQRHRVVPGKIAQSLAWRWS